MEQVRRPVFGEKLVRFSASHRRSIRVWIVSQAIAVVVTITSFTLLIVSMEHAPPNFNRPEAASNAAFWTLLVRLGFAGVTLAGILVGGFRDDPQRHKDVEGYIALDYVAGGLMALGFAVGAAVVDIGFTVIVAGAGFLSFLLLWTFLLIRALSPRGTAAGVIRGATLRTTLHERGYHWVTGEDARHLWQLCGEAAFKLPPWEEVGTLPGVAEGDLESLREVLKLRGEVLKHG